MRSKIFERVRAGYPATVATSLARWALRLGLPLAGMSAMLSLFPCRVAAAGSRFTVQGTVLSRPGLSADTTFGSWTFPHLDWLPVGVHIAPVDLDLVRLSSAASARPARYAGRLRADLVDQLPKIAAWLVGEAIIGILLGMATAAMLNLAIRHLRGLPRRRHELRHRGHQLLAGAIVTVFVVQLGVTTYDPGWNRRSRLSGTLATLQLFPGQLQHYYEKHSKPGDVLSAVSLIQANLQQRITRSNVPPTAFNILLVSDLHLASAYPIVAQYARSFGVSLVLNTGDEAEFGTSLEMTPKYLAQVRGLTEVAPMIWVAGNHDSSTTARIMRQVRGVTVLGTKDSDREDGGVVAQQMTAYGLRIAGIPDPRIYGGPGALGTNDPTQVHELETSSVDRALGGVPPEASFDIVAAHEPIAADRAAAILRGRVRQINAGHLHMQNPDSALQRGGLIRLIEGSTGAGGLDNLNSDVEPPPVEFSIESVAANCQFTKIVRFQIRGTAPTFAKATAGRPPQVTATTHYFLPQRLDQPDRTCDVAAGLTAPAPITGP